jgi:transposase
MGYRGKLVEQARARALRADGHTLADIAAELAVSKSSVSLWVRDVEFRPRPPRRARRRGPNALQQRKAAEIERLAAEGRRRVGTLSEREFLAAGAALYARRGGEGRRDSTLLEQ